jgi:hypothetical protein
MHRIISRRTHTYHLGSQRRGHRDQGIGLVRRFAACFIDRRDPRYVGKRGSDALV